MKLQNTLLIIGLAGLVVTGVYQRLGAIVDDTGILREPFFLVPVAYLMITVGFGGLLVGFLWQVIRRL